MRLKIELISRNEDFVGLKLTDQEVERDVYSHLGYLTMSVKQYLTFERALVLAEIEMREDFSVDLKVPLFREEREKESSGKERK